jgi:hypothetical protein
MNWFNPFYIVLSIFIINQARQPRIICVAVFKLPLKGLDAIQKMSLEAFPGGSKNTLTVFLELVLLTQISVTFDSPLQAPSQGPISVILDGAEDLPSLGRRSPLPCK